MDETSAVAQELRAVFERARDSGTAQEAREAAVAYYRRRAREGGTQASAASELGLNRHTLAKWHQRDAPAAGASSSAAPEREGDGEGDAIRAEVEGLGPNAQSRRFPEELKRQIVSWAERKRACGMATAELAKRLGISSTSLSKWMRESVGGPSSPKLRAVSVVGAPADIRPVLKTPSGFTVEGLDIEGLALLLRRLG